MLDMCKYNMASEHNSTTQVFIHLAPRSGILQTWVSWPNIQSIQVKAQAEAIMSEYRHVEMKKAKKPDYLPDPAGAQDRNWGNKLNVEVQAELLVRLKSLCKNIK